MSEKNSMVSGNNSVYARTGHPVSMTGSLSRYDYLYLSQSLCLSLSLLFSMYMALPMPVSI